MKAQHHITHISLCRAAVVVCISGALLSTSYAKSSDIEVRALKARVAKLEQENAQLKKSLITANYNEKRCADKLAQIMSRLGALGKSFFSEDKDERLLSALAEVEYLTKRVDAIEVSTYDLVDQYRSFAASALVSNPELRSDLEAGIRKVETSLGYRHKPKRQIDTGTLQNARIVSIDDQTGLVVLNVGLSKDARIGMRFNIQRGSTELATGIVAEVRPSVSGLLIEKIHEPTMPLQSGDIAKVLIN